MGTNYFEELQHCVDEGTFHYWLYWVIGELSYFEGDVVRMFLLFCLCSIFIKQHVVDCLGQQIQE